MKNKILFLVVLSFALGCSKNKDYPSLLSKLETHTTSDIQLAQRALANAPSGQCMKDVYSLSLVQSQIKELEKKFSSGPKVQGTWKHLNLEDLPIPQANFLKRFGDQLGDRGDADAFDYSRCRDVPCVFNVIYKKENSLAGHVHYLWYLKMGNYLNASNLTHSPYERTPGQYNGKKFPVSAYLYTDREIYAFWRLMHMLKDPHTSLPHLNVIYHIPRGELFRGDHLKAEEAKRAGRAVPNSIVCGLAYSDGGIDLQDRCLHLSASDNDDGSFYDLVLHEINHHVDYHEGRQYQASYRSHQRDYIAVSGWSRRDYIASNGAPVVEFSQRPGFQPISDYAKTSPVENFADSLAYFRTMPNTSRTKVTLEHWNFISKNYYHDKFFDRANLATTWMQEATPELNQLAFRAVAQCSAAIRPDASNLFSRSDFKIALSADMINCLGARASEMSLDIISSLKATTVDGCKVFNESIVKDLWNPEFKILMAGIFTPYLKELEKNKEYFKKADKFIANINDQAIANDAYLLCSDVATEEECYPETVLKVVYDELKDLRLPQDKLESMAQMYLSVHPLEETTEKVATKFKAFVLSNSQKIQDEGESLFNRCLASPVNDVAPPVGKFFTLGSGYMSSSIYNCINLEFPNAVKEIVRSLSVDGAKVQHAKEELILSRIVSTGLKVSLTSIYLEKREEELPLVKAFIEDKKNNLRQEVTKDFNWVSNVVNNNQVFKDCRIAAFDRIAFSLKYQSRNEMFGAMADKACQNIHTSPEFMNWMGGAKEAFIQKSFDTLEDKILASGHKAAEKCLVSYPVDTSLNRLKFKQVRDKCLTDAWDEVEQMSLKEFESDPFVVKFKVDMNEAKTLVEAGRRRMQLRVMKEKF